MLSRSVNTANTVDLGAQEGSLIPLPNVSSSVMVKILEYCDHHKNEPLPAPDANDQDDARRKTAEIGEWDSKFIVCPSSLRLQA